MTGYKYDAIILVTSQVTLGSFGGEKCGKRQFAQVVHGQSRLHSKMLAQELGISEQTLTRKLKKRVFGTDEASKIVELLSIDNPQAVFLAIK